MFWEMEFSESKIKKFITFSQKNSFLIFPEMELCGSNIKKSLIFLMFWKTKTQRKVIFQETENLKSFLKYKLFNFSAQAQKKKQLHPFYSKNISHTLIFSEKKAVLIFQEMEAPKKFPMFF